jgi:hypothetical protein
VQHPPLQPGYAQCVGREGNVLQLCLPGLGVFLGALSVASGWRVIGVAWRVVACLFVCACRRFSGEWVASHS